MTSFRVSMQTLREERCVLAGADDPNAGRPIALLVALADDGTPRVYRNECMHIAIPLGIFGESIHDTGTLLCGTHGARYRIEDGFCFEGPCVGQVLEPRPFRVEGDTVVIDG